MRKLKTENNAFDLIVSKEYLYYLTGLRRCFKTDLETSIEVSLEEYNRVKYGSNSTHFEEGESAIVLENGNTLRCFYQSSVIREFSSKRELIRELPIEMAMMTIYDFALDENGFIWIVEPTVNRLAQFDFNSGELLFSIGGEFSSNDEFNFPEAIMSRKNELVISDMANQRLAKIDIYSKIVTTYRKFNSPVWEYQVFNNSEIVRLEEGLFILN